MAKFQFLIQDGVKMVTFSRKMRQTGNLFTQNAWKWVLFYPECVKMATFSPKMAQMDTFSPKMYVNGNFFFHKSYNSTLTKQNLLIHRNKFFICLGNGVHQRQYISQPSKLCSFFVKLA